VSADRESSRVVGRGSDAASTPTPEAAASQVRGARVSHQKSLVALVLLSVRGERLEWDRPQHGLKNEVWRSVMAGRPRFRLCQEQTPVASGSPDQAPTISKIQIRDDRETYMDLSRASVQRTWSCGESDMEARPRLLLRSLIQLPRLTIAGVQKFVHNPKIKSGTSS
jgi:hypothetical protein